MKKILTKNALVRAMTSLLIVLFVAGPTPLLQHLAVVALAAGTLSRARTAFKQGDILAAKDILAKEGRTLKGKDKEEAFKLLGVSYYLLGQKVEAREAFAAAIAENPNASIEKSYLLDPSIKGFFEGIKKAGPTAKISNRPRQTSASRASPGGIPPARPGATGIFVSSNASGSTVFANGLFVGTTGQIIELSPGKYQITVSAAGYNPATQKINLGKGQQLELNFKLQDPIELRKQELLAKRELRKKQLAAKALEEKKRQEEQARARAIAKAEAEKRAKAILAQEMAQKALEEARRKQLAEAKAKAEAENRARAIARKKAEDELRELERLEAEELAKAQAAAAGAAKSQQQALAQKRPQRKNQGAASGTINYNEKLPAGRQSLADEFRNDQSRAAPPAAAQPVPSQNQPYDQRQQAPVAPYSGTQQSYPNYQSYQAPPAYAPPAVAPYSQPYVQPRPQPYAPRRSHNKSTFLAFMPLGIGQFQNDDYLLGSLSAITQAGLLGLGIYAYTLVGTARSSFEAEQKKTPNDIPQDYIDETDAYIAQWTMYYQIGFIGFGVVWIASGIEALVSINDNHLAQNGPLGSLDGPTLHQQKRANPANSLTTPDLAKLSFKPIIGFDPANRQHRFGLKVQLTY